MWQKILQIGSGSGGTSQSVKGRMDASTYGLPTYGKPITVDLGFKPLGVYISHSKNGFDSPPNVANRLAHFEDNEGNVLVHLAQQGTIDVSTSLEVELTDTGFIYTNNLGAYTFGAEFVAVGA